jgi:hypothetical protein
MTKLMKGRNAAYYIYGLLLLVVFGVWSSGNFINKRLLRLPVRELQQVPVKQSMTDTKSFYPIWAKTAVAVKADAEASGNVDDFFKKQDERKAVDVPPPQPQEPDYPTMIKQMASLQSVADNGAVINGRFYATGDRIVSLAVVRSAGQPLVPVLAAVQGEGATLSVGRTRVSLVLPKAF